MQRSETVFDSWFNHTSKMMSDWKNASEKWTGDQTSLWDSMGKMQQQWMDGYQSMMRNMASSAPGGAFNPFNQSTTQDAFANMMKSMDVYTHLFQLWQPVFRQMQQHAVSPQDFWKLVDPAGFRSLVDKMFGMDQGKMMQGFVDQYAQMMQLYFNSMNAAGKNFSQSFASSIPFPLQFGMSPQTMSGLYADMMKTTQRSFAPFFGQTTNGTASFAEPMSGMLERYGKYMSKVNEMQTLLYKTGMVAWEDVVRSMNERTAEGNASASFDDFYNMWSAINEKAYVALFNTEEYAALQAELMTMQTEMARMYEKQLEVYLQPYPVVLRSQMEEVYKTNHELRTRINDLERTLAELQNAIKTTTAESGKAAKKG
jgi:hypothetical protein